MESSSAPKLSRLLVGVQREGGHEQGLPAVTDGLSGRPLAAQSIENVTISTIQKFSSLPCACYENSSTSLVTDPATRQIEMAKLTNESRQRLVDMIDEYYYSNLLTRDTRTNELLGSRAQWLFDSSNPKFAVESVSRNESKALACSGTVVLVAHVLYRATLDEGEPRAATTLDKKIVFLSIGATCQCMYANNSIALFYD